MRPEVEWRRLQSCLTQRIAALHEKDCTCGVNGLAPRGDAGSRRREPTSPTPFLHSQHWQSTRPPRFSLYVSQQLQQHAFQFFPVKCN